VPDPSVRHVSLPPKGLTGDLRAPEAPAALVVFAHGSGSSRLSVRNVAVAERFGSAGIATLLFDLLTEDEAADRRNVFDIPLLASRLVEAVGWAGTEHGLSALPLGLFGASTGAAAALVAAATLDTRVGAVVSRGGRPDLAGEALQQVRAPTLLIVGGADVEVLELNRWALERLGGIKALEVIPGATHLFPEPGALETAADLAIGWCRRHLGRTAPLQELPP